MPTDRTGTDGDESSPTITRKTSLKDVPPEPRTAPLLLNTKEPSATKSQKVVSATRKRTVKHVKILHTRATNAAIQVSHTYKKADRRVIQTTKRLLPEKTLHQLAANRSANGGNLRFVVPISKKTQRKVPVVLPKGLRHIRHAALPGALVAVLFFALGFVGASPPGYGGTKVMGGSGNDMALQTVIDESDNVYTLGTFNGTVNFAADWSGTDSKTSTETNGDVFLTKMNANGTYGWTKQITGSVAGSQYDYKVAINSAGVVYVAGTFDGTVNFAADWSGTDEKTSIGASDAFLTKVNNDGTYGWTKQIGGSGNDSVTGLAVNVADEVIAMGTFSDTVVFDTDFGTTADSKVSNGLSDIFVTTINDDGTYGSTKRVGGTQADLAGLAATSGSGDLYFTGVFDGTVNFATDWAGSDEKVCADDISDASLTKINANGTYGWTKCINETGAEVVSAIQVDTLGAVYVGGKFNSSSANFAADFSGTDIKTKLGAQDAFITKINANGTYGWTHTIGGNEATTSLSGLTADTQNNLYLSGSFGGSTVNFAADFSGSDAKSVSTVSSFITKIKSDNSYDWTVTSALGIDAVTSANDIAADSQDNIFSVGNFGKTVNFAADFAATDERTSIGDDAAYSDAFITKIATVETVYKVTDASGLTYKDSEGTNLSSVGTADTNPTVYVHDQDDDTVLATIAVDLSEDRDWSTVGGDSDTDTYKMFVNDVIGAPGADATMTLYVPKNAGDNAVILCPNVEDLVSVTKTCANKRTLTSHDAGVATSEIAGVDYWAIANVTDEKIGGISTGFPGVAMTETDGNTAVTEGGAGDYVSVVLNAQPTEDVTVTIVADPDTQLESIDPITFTSSDWDTPVNVYVEAIDDSSIEGGHSVSVGYSAASADEYYDETGESNVVTVDITDNDQAGVVLHNTDNLITEGDDSAAVCVTLTAQPSQNVTLNLGTSDTSETTIPGSITITSANWDNQPANCFTVGAVDDDEVDGPKDSDISVSSITSDDTNFAGLDTGTITPITITTQDNDSAAFNVTATETTTTEAGDSIDVCIELTARPTSSVTIPVSSSDTSEGSLGATTNIIIAPVSWNSGSNCVTVTGVDDDIVDGDISYTITTGDPTSADSVWEALDASAVADQGVTNEDDDIAGITVTQTSDTTVAAEGGATDTVSVVLTSQPAPSKQVVVKIQPDTEVDLGGGAGQAATKTFTESDWSTPQSVTVTAIDDASVEGDHSSIISITVDPETTEIPYLGLEEQTVTANITDNDIATASIAIIDDATENPSSNGTFRVTLDHQNDTGSNMTFDYNVTGTAISGTHYAALSGSATVPTGASTADITVDVEGLNNELLEGNKSVIVTLTESSNGSGAISETDDAATMTIFDDDETTASLSKTQDGDEEGPAPVEFTVTLGKTNNTGGDITVKIDPSGGTATVGDDYESFTDEDVVIPDGASSGIITIPVIDDNNLETTAETLQASISEPSIALVSIAAEEDAAEATITDNDTAELSVSATQATANENPSSNGTIRIALDKPNNTGTSIEVTYTTSGTASAESDYDSLPGTVVIADGQQSADVTVDTGDHDDDDMEGNETVIATYESNTLSSRVSIGENDAATVTIVDDETAGITATATDDTTGEDGSTGTICFTLASRPSDPVTIALNSSNENKVTVPGSITIERDDWDQASENCVTVTGQDDEPPSSTGTEDVIIQTSGVTTDDPFYTLLTGGDIADITIHHADNDTPGISVQTVADKTKEDGSKVATLRFSLSTQPSSAVTIPITISDATEAAVTESEIVIEPEDWNTPANNQVEVTGVDDNLTDGDITYQLATGDPTSSDGIYDALGADDVTNPSLINEDDDEAGITITQSSGTTTATEGGATDTVDITLASQPAPGNEVVVGLDPNNEVDLGGGAGQEITRTFTNANWNDAQQITITAVDDEVVEGDHTGNISVSVGEATTETAYDDLDAQAINVAISDNDSATASIAKISDATESPSENGTFRVTLDKINHTGSGMDFTYSVSGTATSGTHYAALSGTVAVADNANSADITIDTSDLNNELLEGNKTVSVTLTGSVSENGTVSETDNSATLTIADDERATVGLAATQNGNEAGSVPIIYTATLSKQNDTGSDISVAIDPSGGNATTASDYQDFSDQTIVIPDGSAIGTFQVTVIDDAIFEATTETVIATISDPSSDIVTIDEENNAAEATIADNDVAELSIVATDAAAAENPSANGTITFQLDKTNKTGSAITIDYTISGTAAPNDDYDTLSGSVSIADGQQSATATVNTEDHDDDDMEGDETVVVTYEDNSIASRVSIGENDAATVTIADDEVAGVNVNVTDNSTSEGGATGTICFTLSSRPSASVTIALTSTDATKVTVPSSVTIAQGDWNSPSENCITATGLNDNPPEVTGTQSVGIQTTGVVSDDPFYALLTGGDIADATMNHADNDTPGIDVQTVSGHTKEDGSKTAIIRFELTTQPTDDVVIPLSVSDSTEGAIAVSEVTITPENWNTPIENEITVTGVDDSLTDGDVTYQLVTGDPTSSDEAYDGLEAGDIANPSLVNEDDDHAGVTITQTSDTTVATEGGTTDTIETVLTSQPAPDNEVVVRIDPNEQVDLGEGTGQLVTRTFTSENWDDIQEITVAAVDDDSVEGDHTGSIVISVDETTTESAYDELDDQTVAVTITDNDIATASIAKISDATENPNENGTFRVTLDKTNHTGEAMDFTYAVGGTATGGTHYVALSGIASVADATDTVDITVDVSDLDNALLEGDKTVIVTLTDSISASGAVSETDNSATLTIADDERAEVDIEATQNGNEEDTVPVIYTATLSKQNDTGSDISVAINPSGGSATASNDYQDFSDQTIVIPNGASVGTADVTVLDDGVFEATTETVVATISDPSNNLVTIDGENDTAQATITDNDTAELSITTSEPNATENPEANGTITVDLDKTNNTGSAITVDYTISGTATPNSDYDVLSGSVSIASGQQSADVVVTTEDHDDNDMEGDETVVVTYESNDTASRVDVGENVAATVTIADDETAGVTMDVTDNSTSESGATGTVCFTLASRPSAPVTISLVSSDASKVTVPTSVTIAREDWNNANCVTVAGHDDEPPEVTGMQTVTIQTTGITTEDPFYAQLNAGDIDDATINHADNDLPGIDVQAVSTRTKEDGTKIATIRLELTTQPTDSVIIPVSISDSTEGNSTVSEVTVTPENWNAPVENEIIVTGVDDDLIDGDVTYQLITGDPTSSDATYNGLSASDVANVTLINEDDDEASVSISESGGATAVTEGGATDTVSVHIGTQPASGNQVVITVSPADTQLDLGAGAGVPIDLTFTDEDWSTPQPVTVTAFDDTLLENAHSSQITYAVNTAETTESPYNDYSDSLPATTVIITDNDTATADFTVQNGNEAGPTPIMATVTLSKQNDTAAPITFSLNPNGGTATAATDYANFTNTTVSIPIGETSADIEVGVVDDALLEGNETVGLALSNPSLGAVTVPAPTTTATITDNDTATATIVATDSAASENPATNGEFTVYLSKVNTTGAPITITYDVSGTATLSEDYTALSGEVAIANGVSSVVIPVMTTGHNDATVENSETVIVTLQSASYGLVSIGNPDTATVTIADDDGFTTSIQTLEDGDETGPTNITYRVGLSQVNTTGNPVTVDIADSTDGSATSSDDYQSFGGTVSIANGQQYTDYIVTVIDDNDLENIEETVGAELSNPSEGELGIATATATIADNETATATVAATQATATENPSTNGEFTISLDKQNNGTSPILITYTTNGTATGGQDYAGLSGTAMIAAGTSDTVVVVNTEGYDDSNYEGNETITLTLSSTDHTNVSIGSPNSATVTVTDDDPEPEDPGDEVAPPDDDTSSTGGDKSTPIQPTQRVIVRVPVDTETVQQTAEPEAAVPSEPQPVDQTSRDLDSDGIDDEVENKANNNGDGNGDGIPDSQQENVASVVSNITNKPVTLESRGDCAVVEHFKVIAEDKLDKQDQRYKYPFGLVDYKLSCEASGQSTVVTIYYDQTYDNPGNWRKFAPGSEKFAALDFVKNVKQPVGRTQVTTATYSIRDGGDQDDDGKSNGKIADPAGFAIRTFYILDIGWAIPVLLAGWFVGYAIWHRAKDHRRYR